MSISSQLPPIVLAQASPGLRALAQVSGQTVEARILSQSSNGTAQVQIGRQTLNLALPEGQVVGSTLTLSVQQSDGQLRLGILAVRPPTSPTVPQMPPSATAPPATSVQLSAAALASPSLSQVAPASSGMAPAASPLPAGSRGSAAAGAMASSAAAVARPAAGYGPPTLQVTQPTAPSPAVTQINPTLPPPGASAGASAANSAVQMQGAVLPGATGPSAPSLGIPPGAASAVQGAAVPGAAQQGAAAGQVGALGQQLPGAVPSLASAAGRPVQPAVTGHVAVRGELPYAIASPAGATPPVTAQTTPAASGLPPVAQMTAGTMVGQHAPSPGGAPPAPTGAVASSVVPTAPQAAATPQAAIAQMVQQSLPRQDSIVGLTKALTAIAGKVALPEPVAKAAQQVLAARLPIDGGKLTGTAIKAAVQMSGVFQEALLASGQGGSATGDLKSALLSLRQSLGAWLGNQAPVAQVSGLAPPIRGHIPRARSGDGALQSLPDDPLDLGKMLTERTDAALSRLRLHQNASLPDPAGLRQDAQWSMDLPVIVSGQQQVLHLQIQRDAEQEAERTEERSWQVRFAINLAERGEVGAQISLRAKNTSVLLWADRDDTARSLAGAVDGLRQELGEAGLVAGAIVVRAGAPAAEAIQPAASDGHVLDATR